MALLDIISRLRSQLLQSGLQKRDNPLFQVINQLIGLLQSVGQENAASINVVDTSLKNATYVTSTNQVAVLPNSRVLTAGTDITLDTSVAGVITINSSGGGSSGHYEPLTNGIGINPELVYTSFGDVIMVHVP